MSVVGIAFGVTQDKVKDYSDKKKREKIKVFRDDKIETLDDYFRLSFGSPGESARVLTKNYYSLFFENKTKTKENLLALLHFRNNVWVMQGIGLENKLLEELADRYKNDISGAIFTIVVYENSFQKVNHFVESNFKLIHKVVLEEYNKMSPNQYNEYYTYTPFNFLSTKNLFERYGIELTKHCA